MKRILAILILISSCMLNAEWNIETPSKNVPGNLEGSIWGKDFVLDEATWDEMTLEISSKKKGNWPERELVFFFGNDDETTEFFVTPEDDDMEKPHIHMKFAKKGKTFPGTLIFMSEYSLYLKVVERDDKKAKFQIHLSLPDYKKTTLIGTFEAKIE